MTISKSRKLFYTFLILLIITPVSFAQAPVFDRDLLNLGATESGYIKAYNQIKLFDAYQYLDSINPSLAPVRIGIIDSGIDADHPEFQNVDLDDTSVKARIDRVESGHGTQVAGIIGANNISFPNPENYVFPQMNGILSGVKNLDYSLAVDYDGGPNIFKILFDIRDLVKNKEAEIINISSSIQPGVILGCLTQQNVIKPVFRLFLEKLPNSLFVVSAGEVLSHASDVECFTPANLGDELSNVIAVGGLNSSGEERSEYSTFGDAINISAPAEDVYAPRPPFDHNNPETYYDAYFGGNSASAPLVAGAAGLLKAIKPELTASEIKDILIQTADPITTDQPIGGRLNAAKAVKYLFPPTGWSLPETIYTDPEWIHWSAVTSDNSGNLHMVWIKPVWISGSWRNQVYYTKRDQVGWSEPIVISSQISTNSAQPDIVADNLNRIHVFFAGRSSATSDDVFYTTYNGTEWSEPLKISNSSGYIHDLIRATSDSNNNIHVVWDILSGSPTIFYAKKTNETWSEPIAISPPPAGGFCGSAFPLIVSDNNNHLHAVMYSCLNVAPGGTLYYTKFNGTQWSEPFNLNIFSSGNSSGTDFALAVDKFNHPHLIFSSNISGTWGMYHIYWNGSNWTSPVAISGPGNHYTQLAHLTVDDSGVIHGIWHEQIMESLPEYEWQIVYSNYDGNNWFEPQALPNIPVSGYPINVLVDTSNHIHVIYGYSQDVKYYFSHIWK